MRRWPVVVWVLAWCAWLPVAQATTTQVLIGGIQSPLVTGAAQYGAIESIRATGGTESAKRTLGGAAGTLTGFMVRVATAPGGATSWTVTVRENAAATVLSCAITGTATSCTDNDAEVIAEASELTVSVTPSASDPAATLWISWFMFFTPTTTGETRYGGGSDNNLSNSVTNDLPALNLGFASTSEEIVESLIAVPGTFSNFYADLSGTPGAGNSYTFTLIKNGSACGTITCAISETATTCSDLTNVCTVAAGDELRVESVPASTPTARTVAYGMRFTPTTEGDFMFSFMDDASLNNASTTYAFLTTPVLDPGTTETSFQMVAPSITALGYYVNLLSAPDNGAGTQSYAFTLRSNAANTGQTCTISETDTTCNITSSIDRITANSLLNHQIVPTNTPSNTGIQPRIGVRGFISPFTVLHTSTLEASVIQ